jgi:phage replication O-like protein O
MANPQKENGYTAIANDIMDALISFDMSGQDFKIALLILRKTYGYNKCEDAVSLSQMQIATGMGKIRCSQVVTRLQLMKILTVTENINGIGKKYKFNKDFETWGTVSKNINRLEKVKSTVNVLRKIPLMKSVTTKDNIQKTIYSEAFLKFWAAYPKKTGSKKAAFDNWNKLNGQRPEIGIILNAISNQTEWRKNANGEFRPEWKDPERWLKGRMWEAETGKQVEAPTEQPKKYTVIDPKDIMERQRRRDEGELLL